MTGLPLRDLAREVLTERQFVVWELAEGGMTERQIASHLGVARSTVRDHLEAAERRLTKMGGSE